MINRNIFGPDKNRLYNHLLDVLLFVNISKSYKQVEYD